MERTWYHHTFLSCGGENQARNHWRKKRIRISQYQRMTLQLMCLSSFNVSDKEYEHRVKWRALVELGVRIVNVKRGSFYYFFFPFGVHFQIVLQLLFFKKEWISSIMCACFPKRKEVIWQTISMIRKEQTNS